MATIITAPKVDISKSLLDKLSAQVQEQGQVIVHFVMHTKYIGVNIRIWPTTYLFDQHSDHRSELVHAENISHYPVWTEIYPGNHFFTLIFSGLPKSCSTFDLIEKCTNEHGAFSVKNITRSENDVYYVQI